MRVFFLASEIHLTEGDLFFGIHHVYVTSKLICNEASRASKCTIVINTTCVIAREVKSSENCQLEDTKDARNREENK